MEWNEIIKLLGEEVQVIITDKWAFQKIIVEGKLLSFGTNGEFVVEDNNGFIQHCWPMLDIRKKPYDVELW